MTTHAITLDEITDHDSPDVGFAAFCTEECGWRGDWHHADDQPAYDRRDPLSMDYAITQAEQSATDEGADHLAEVFGTCACGAPMADTTPGGGLRCADGCPPVAPEEVDTMPAAVFLALPVPALDANGYAR